LAADTNPQFLTALHTHCRVAERRDRLRAWG